MSYTFLGKLPDPFMKADGTRMSADEWFTKRDEIFLDLCDKEFGGMPPRPEVVRVERLSAPRTDGLKNIYKIYAGTKERQLTILLDVTTPRGAVDGSVKYPIMLTGDGCYNCCESETINAACAIGIGVARFNRLELANDDKNAGRVGGLYDIYPEHKTFTAISAWAWGYMTVMDALEKIPHIDTENVGLTSHSRGGKTVLLAAAADTRIKFACPNNSGCHGAVSHRCSVTEQGENKKRSERLGDMLKQFPHWMGPKLTPYAGREQDLPYDMHYFGVLVAPRYYLQCEGLQDYWINPIGAWQNLSAVKACYRRLGCEDHAAGWFRPGEHRHKLPDFTEFMNFMDRARAGLPLAEHLTINPFPQVELNFDWGEEDA